MIFITYNYNINIKILSNLNLYLNYYIMIYKLFYNSPFLINLKKNLTVILICYLVIIIFLVIIQYFFLKKDLAMSITHGILIGGLITL